MNQRDDTPGSEHTEHARETNGGREFYPGRRGFEERAYGAQGGSGRDRSSSQSAQGQYERDSLQGQRSDAERDQERWHSGFERPTSYRGYDPRYSSRGPAHERSESDRYRPVTEEWEAARGYAEGSGESRYGGEGWSGEPRRREGGWGREGWGEGGADRWSQGRSNVLRAGHGPSRYEDRYGGYQDRQGRYGGQGHGRYGWETGASQPDYGPRAYWRDRPSWQDQYGFGQGRRERYQYRPETDLRARWREGSSSGRFPRDEYGREHSSEQLYDREPFARREDLHYYGTGAPGWGGPGFTGGAYGYGYGPRYPSQSIESEYSDESSVGYEGSYGRGYGRGYGGAAGYGGARQYARGPKGYQRSDERLKEDISERLMEAHDIDSSEVTVDVKGAKVILEGVVPSRHMKHAIEDLVDACPGVQDIDNRIRVASPNYQGSTTTTAGISPSGTQTQGATSSQGSGASQSGSQTSQSSQTSSPGSRTRQ